MGCNGSKSTSVSTMTTTKELTAREPTADIFIVFVLGGPGSGKGTQCAKVAEEFGFRHVSTGDLFRNEVKQDTRRADKVRHIMKEGKLIPTDLTLEILADALDRLTKEAEHAGTIKLLLDGFPREISQVLDFKKKFGRDCNFALYFDVPAEVMKDRCLKRGQSSGRSDDNEETITQRVDTYFEKSKPVVDHYESDGLLKRVDANRDIDAIYEDVRDIFSTQPSLQ